MLSVKQGGIKYHFLKIFEMTRPEIEPWFPGPLLNKKLTLCCILLVAEGLSKCIHKNERFYREFTLCHLFQT